MSVTAQMFEPPLLRFLRALDLDEKEAFAAAVGTSLQYLQQMVGQPAPNPALRLAMAMEAESHRLGRLLGTDPLSLPDLLIGRVKAKHVLDHTTGEAFTMLPNGEMARRRVDGQGRIVLLNAKGDIVDVEEARPSPTTVKKVRPLDE